MKDKKKFGEYVLLLGEKYDKEISKAMTSLIWRTLQPFSDKECEKAFEGVLLRSRYFKDILPDLLDLLGQSEEDQATLAWLEVDKAVRQIGPLASVQFSDAIIHSTIDALGGWESLGNITEYDWKWTRKDFITMYPIMSKKSKHPKRLIGQTERENLGRNYGEFIPETIRIGIAQEKIQKLEFSTNRQEKRHAAKI